MNFELRHMSSPTPAPRHRYGSNRYGFVMPGVFLVFGVVCSFAWVAFLGWCFLNFVL